MSNARIQFSTASEEKWQQVNPTLREGELVIVKKTSGKRKLVVGNAGGSTYSESEVVWDAEEAAGYATQAANGAASATSQATAAAASASSAATYATNAASSATNAKTYATNAASSATNAKTYATNAASSATAAATSATNASNSATAAQSASSTSSNFATGARNSANEALTYRNNASTYADNAKTYMETAKDYSENVNVFVPSVSSDGIISWTNKAGLTNPSPVSVKGATGEAGKAATIAIGTVTTGEAGTSVSVTNSGTTSAAVFNFVIPKGKDGGVTVDSALSSTSTNPVQNKVINTALNKKANTSSLATVATSGSYNDLSNTPTIPDVSSFAQTGVANTWTAAQVFSAIDYAVTTEKFVESVTPSTSVAYYLASGTSFTLNLANFVDSLNDNQSMVFTCVIYNTNNSDLTLTVTGASAYRYIGSASDLSISASTMLLLNVLLVKPSGFSAIAILQGMALSNS